MVAMNSIDANGLCFLPATELAVRIRRRDVSPVEVVKAYLGRIEDRNPSINAYTLVLADQALDAAREAESAVMSGRPLGPLHGVPIAIKDLNDLLAFRPLWARSRSKIACQRRAPQLSKE
jgi:Asp-tRNA(Asn)/Glu-tRNA(Gln) amidotransferase A subunit family amidase